MDPLLVVIIVAALLVIFLIMLISAFASLFRKVGPNQALIVYGFGLGQPKVVRGGGWFVLPVFHQSRELSLELMSFDVAPQQDLYTTQGVAVNVEAVAQIKVRSDPESILTAAEQFLSKDQSEREGLIRLVMEGHLRGIVGQLTVESIVKDPEMVSERMRANVAEDVAKMGLEVVSFTIKEVKDSNQYIENMGKPDIARIKREADIAAAEASRDTSIKRAMADREAAVAKAEADQERVIAEAASQTRQAEAQRDLAIKTAEYETSVKRQQAQADKAYDIEANVMQQRVVAEQVRIERVQKEEQVKVQEMEVARREQELMATVLKAAEAERLRIQLLAEAERQRLALEAVGRAEAAKAQGIADAEVIQVKGLAEAQVIKAKGESEAEAMTLKAAAFQQYNQAAIVDKLLTGFPEVVRAMAEPLSKVDKITIVSTGDGQDGRGLGANQITGDIAKIIAQVPALFETLSGMKIGDLLARIQPLGGAGGGVRADPAALPAGDGRATGAAAAAGAAEAAAEPTTHDESR